MARVNTDILGISKLKWSVLKTIDHILCSWRWRNSVQSAKIRPGTDCGSDHELLIEKFRLKLKKVGKITRPFRYDWNQIAYNYTVEVTNSFKGLDLRDRVPEELWTEVHDIAQKAVIKTIPKTKKCKKSKWLSEETLQIAEKRSERQRRKGKIYLFECRVPKNSRNKRDRRDKKAFLSDQCKEMKITEWERLEISSRKLEIPRGHFMQRWAR